MIVKKKIGRFVIETFNGGSACLELQYNEGTKTLFHLQAEDIHDLGYVVECLLRDADQSSDHKSER